VRGLERTYLVAERLPSRKPRPLLVVLHGSGIDGALMAAWTGLAVRGPEAGFATVFPQGREEMWDDVGLGRRDGADDPAFISALVDRLGTEGMAVPGATVLIGLSNGAFFAERLARHGLVAASALILVSGTARGESRRACPRPVRPAAVLCIEGTADRLVPYGGGMATGTMAWLARRRARRILRQPADREVVAAETLCSDWAAANGCAPLPVSAPVPRGAADGIVQRLSWSVPGHRPVVLYRIEGGGHTWPGGPRYMPGRLVGRAGRDVDATGIALDFAREQVEPRT
jgi:polyhydroxybutyrate depolymerase